MRYCRCTLLLFIHFSCRWNARAVPFPDAVFRSVSLRSRKSHSRISIFIFSYFSPLPRPAVYERRPSRHSSDGTLRRVTAVLSWISALERARAEKQYIQILRTRIRGKSQRGKKNHWIPKLTGTTRAERLSRKRRKRKRFWRRCRRGAFYTRTRVFKTRRLASSPRKAFDVSKRTRRSRLMDGTWRI